MTAAATRRSVFRALLLRDLTVLDGQLKEFLPNTLMQPLLLVFVFGYLFPAIGQGVGGSSRGAASRFATLMLPGIVAQAIVMQGMFRVAVPLMRELSLTRELEDRVLAPATVTMVALEKIAFGALQGLFAALVVFPVAAFVPATPIYLDVDWPVLATVLPLACVAAAAFGLCFATLVNPRLVPLLAGTVVLPLTFGGAIFYTWSSLDPLPWLKYLVLVNPLVYMSEGLRAGMVTGVDHMPLAPVYLALAGSAAVLTALGVRGFKRRVLG